MPFLSLIINAPPCKDITPLEQTNNKNLKSLNTKK